MGGGALLCDGGPDRFQFFHTEQIFKWNKRHFREEATEPFIVLVKTGMKRAETAGPGLDCLL